VELRARGAAQGAERRRLAGLLADNVAARATVPRLDPNADRLPARVPVWSEEQARRFLELSADHELADLWRVALGTGMRRGELLGLRWQDVDLAVPQVRSSPRWPSPRLGRGSRAPRPAAPGRSTSTTTPPPRSTASPGGTGSWPLVFAGADGAPLVPAWVSDRWRFQWPGLELPRSPCTACGTPTRPCCSPRGADQGRVRAAGTFDDRDDHGHVRARAARPGPRRRHGDRQRGEKAVGDDADDAEEVRNYVLTMEHGLHRLREGFPVSVRLFREMHERLLAGVRGEHRRPGELRSSPVWIGGANLQEAVFVPPPAEEMRVALQDLEQFLHERELPLLVQLAIAHYQFEVIHPFLDGNGRIGRLLIPLMLVLRGALPEPLLYLSAYFERNRTEYYDHLLATSQHGDLEPWLEFFLRGVRRQARDAEERTVRLVELQHRLRSDLLDEGRPNSVVRLGELLFSTPVITAPRAEQLLGVTRPTAQAAIDALVERGDAVEVTGKQRGRVYEAPYIFEAVYGPVDLDEETSDGPRASGESA
jgi:Fic family protein